MSKHPLTARLDAVQLVPPTPFAPDGSSVNFGALRNHVRIMFEAGMRAFLPAAGTGEFHSLSVEEVLGCVRATRDACGGDSGNGPVVMAPTGLGLGHAIAIAERAADAGADAILIMPLVHPYLCDSGFRDYFDAIAAATSLPLLTYKKGPVPSDRLLTELADSGRLIGVKYAVNDLDAFQRFADARGDKIGLYCGTAERFAPFFATAGAAGYTSGAGNLCPRLTLALHRALIGDGHSREAEQGRRDGHEDEPRDESPTSAKRLLAILRPIEDFRARDGDSFNISLLKAGLALIGRDFGPVRPPQRRLTASETEAVERMLGPILQAEAALAIEI